MKNLRTVLHIALFVLGSFQVFANADSTGETAGIVNPTSSAGDDYRIQARAAHEFKRFVNRRHVDILIVGKGGAILICL